MQSRRTLSRLVIGSALGVVLAAPGWAHASSPEAGEQGRHRGQCRRLTRQIDHFENTVLPMAHQRGNRAWAKATEEQVERLWHRRADLCPAYGAERSLMRRAADQARKFNRLLADAGRAAAAFFTGGLSGGM
ncbi:MAG: hypothetical protein CL908_27300 [Deltaproteobacteria bacterium]|nr:hypothetical protein [Deltaproteobacteria bacterium]